MSDARGDADGADETESATAGVASDGATESRATDGDTASNTGGRPCPRCDRPMIHRHCKYVCPEHGVVYDCSDTFY